MKRVLTTNKSAFFFTIRNENNIDVIVNLSSLIIEFIISQGWFRRKKKVTLPVHLTTSLSSHRHHLTVIYSDTVVIVGYRSMSNKWIEELKVYESTENLAKEKLQQLLITKGWIVE